MHAERGLLETSDDAVLGGRLTLRQPLRGHRVGHDAILLAAATGGRAGELAVDLGAGVGAAGLALAARVAGLKVDAGRDRRGALRGSPPIMRGSTALPTACARSTCDVEDAARSPRPGLRPASADRVLMNPPFNDARRHKCRPMRAAASRLRGDAGPAARAGSRRRHFCSSRDGVLTLIWRADGLADGAARRSAGDFGGIAVLPVYPREGAAAIRVLVRAVKGGARRADLSAGLILNDTQGQPSAAAEAVLRGGEVIRLCDD